MGVNAKHSTILERNSPTKNGIKLNNTIKQDRKQNGGVTQVSRASASVTSWIKHEGRTHPGRIITQKCNGEKCTFGWLTTRNYRFCGLRAFECGTFEAQSLCTGAPVRLIDGSRRKLNVIVWGVHVSMVSLCLINDWIYLACLLKVDNRSIILR